MKVEELIQESNNTLAQAFNTGDYDLLATCYTNDATLLPAAATNEKAKRHWLHGKQDITGFFKMMREQVGVRDLKLRNISVLEYENGNVQCLGFAQYSTGSGNFSHYYQKQPDGSYLILNDIMTVL